MRIIKYLDIISPKPKLFIHSQERYKTVTGGIFSILSVLTISFIALYLAYMTFKRDIIKIVYNETQNEFPNENFFDKPALYVIHDGYGRHYDEPDRYFNLKPVFKYFNKTDILLNKTEPEIDKNCNGNYSKYWPKYAGEIPYTGQYNCINPNDPAIKGKTIYNNYGDSKNGFSVLNIHINRCINTTKYKNCHSPEEIERALSESYVTIGIITNSIDAYDLNQVYKPFLKTIVVPISTTIFKKVYFKFRGVDFMTDEGYVFEELKSEKFTLIEPFTENVDNRKVTEFPGNFVVLTFTNSYVLQKHMRSFPKLQSLVANIGGTIKAILFTATIVENYIVDAIYYIQLSNCIISFDELESETKNEKNDSRQNLRPINISLHKNVELGPSGTNKIIPNLDIGIDNKFKQNNIKNDNIMINISNNPEAQIKNTVIKDSSVIVPFRNLNITGGNNNANSHTFFGEEVMRIVKE